MKENFSGAREGQVDIIDQIEEFNALKERWVEIYTSDPDAAIYTSWSYLKAWFMTTTSKWFVIAVREKENGRYIGFLPLAHKNQKTAGLSYRLITIGTSPLPVYSGFLCKPDCLYIFIDTVILFFKERKIKWDKLFITNVCDPKMRLLLSAFSSFSDIEKTTAIPGLTLKLPDSYERYLNDYFSGHSRKHMRRIVRRIENAPEAALTNITAATAERDIDLLVDFWLKRWKKEELAAYERKMLRYLFTEQILKLYVFWYEEKPVSAFCFL
jgi:hypothetical protein